MLLLKRICIISLVLSFIFSVTGCKKKTYTRERIVNKIAFLSNRDADQHEFDIFLMNRDGSEQKNLTKHIKGLRSFSKPVISHDGEKILFLTSLNGKRTLQTMEIGDSIAKPLAQVNVDATEYSFSPDDKIILFTNKVEKYLQIFTITSDGTNLKNLSGNNLNESEAKFSPDGSQICFTTKSGNTKSIGIMNTDGADRDILTDDRANDLNPSFSPDGSKITFNSFRSGNSDIYYIDVSSKKLIKVFAGNSYDIEPRFTPDGQNILFVSNVRGMRFRDLLLINIETGNLINLTKDTDQINQNPVILPDGLTVLFESTHYENFDIYEIGIDGKNLKDLSEHPRLDIAPAF